MTAHENSFRDMTWSNNGNYFLTSDSGGNIKYWNPSITPVESFDSHEKNSINGLSFSPMDTKFASGGDDATVRIWDWEMHREEKILKGHGWDVKCVEWHPRSSVVCTGGKTQSHTEKNDWKERAKKKRKYQTEAIITSENNSGQRKE